MAELVNLRTARKQAKRRQSEQRADGNRLAHGQPKHLRKLHDEQQAKAARELDGHRIETGDGR
jgi:phage terminase small subunit